MSDDREKEPGAEPALLEPVAPRSSYAFVEIDQAPIPYASPFAMLGCLPRAAAVVAGALRRRLLLVCVVAVALVVVELALRGAAPELTGRVHDAARTGGHWIARNAQGARGAVVAAPKPSGVWRVLALGDSVTMGTGVGVEDTWAYQLQAALGQDREVEVVNTGLPGLDLGQVALELRTRWRELEPDELVLALSGNMITFAAARAGRVEVQPPPAGRRDPTRTADAGGAGVRLGAVYSELAIPNAVVLASEHFKYALGLERHRYDPADPGGVMLANGYVQDGQVSQLVETAYAEVAAQLAAVARIAEELGAPLTVTFAPPRFTLDRARRNNLKFVDHARLTVDPVARVAELCRSMDLPFVDVRDALRETPEPYVISDYTHFSRSGHGAVARALAARLRRR